MGKLIDFDAFRAERVQDPVRLKIGGKTYDLPPSMPASIAVDLIHIKTTLTDDADVPVEMLDNVGRSIFGADTWRAVLEEHRIQVDEIGDLIQMVLEAYSPAKDADADPQVASTQET